MIYMTILKTCSFSLMEPTTRLKKIIKNTNVRFFLHLIFSHKLNSTYLFFNPNDT